MGVNADKLKNVLLSNQIIKGLDIDESLIRDATPDELESIKKKTEYFNNITKYEKKTDPITLNELKQLFVKTFEFEECKKLQVTKQIAPYYSAIAEYFVKDDNFNKTKLTENIPSLDKGLLLIGGVGCGKTSIMNTYHKIGYKRLPYSELWFSKVSCLSVVQEFESINDANINERDEFNNKYNNTKVMYFDDFGSENEASKYGKRNLMREILEERYTNKKLTHLTTNLSLEQINAKYGFRVFDRLQEMFNIIIMKNGSFRK